MAAYELACTKAAAAERKRNEALDRIAKNARMARPGASPQYDRLMGTERMPVPMVVATRLMHAARALATPSDSAARSRSGTCLSDAIGVVEWWGATRNPRVGDR